MTEKENELYRDRIKKLELLKAEGVEPYPAASGRTHTIAQVLRIFDTLTKKGGKVILTGRLRALRGHGKLTFGNLEDESGIIQFVVKADEVTAKQAKIFSLFDVGDLLQIEGPTFITKKGERTILVKDVVLLTKSLRALPEKYHGLKDTEMRLRKRYLDMLANPEVRKLIRKKSLFWQSMRNFLQKKGFLEVETPVLESIPGGAEARPFITHHNALDRDFFLRISLELPLKRLLVGGFEKIFEIGRIFRNEGIDTEHLQDYTQMEFYWAYENFDNLRKFVQEMYQHVIKETFGTLKTTYQGAELDWGGEWEVNDFYDLMIKYTGVQPGDPREKIEEATKKFGIDKDLKGVINPGRRWDIIYSKLIRPNLIKPQFMIRTPVEMEPLAKRDPSDNRRVLRLQVIAAGTELGKGFSELNDPLDQKARFEEQMDLRKRGDKEAQILDEDFVEALEYGMPPSVGFGLSERLFAVLMGKSVREAVIFPPMKEE